MIRMQAILYLVLLATPGFSQQMTDPLEAMLSAVRQREIANAEILWRDTVRSDSGTREAYYYTAYAHGDILTEARGDHTGLCTKHPGPEGYRRLKYLTQRDGSCFCLGENRVAIEWYNAPSFGAQHPRYYGFFVLRTAVPADMAAWLQSSVLSWESLTDLGDRVEVRGTCSTDQGAPTTVFTLLKTTPHYTLLEAAFERKLIPPGGDPVTVKATYVRSSYDGAGLLTKVQWYSTGGKIESIDGEWRAVGIAIPPYEEMEVLWYSVPDQPVFGSGVAGLHPVVGTHVAKFDPTPNDPRHELFRWDGANLVTGEAFADLERNGLVDLTEYRALEKKSRDPFDVVRFSPTSWAAMTLAARTDPARWKEFALDKIQWQQLSPVDAQNLMTNLQSALAAANQPNANVGVIFDTFLAD